MRTLWTILGAVLLLSACGSQPATPANADADRPRYESLYGRYWLARMPDGRGGQRIVQRLEFIAGQVRRVVFDLEMAEVNGGKVTFVETELPLTVTSTGKDFILLDIAGGKEVWRIMPQGPDEIRIGSTTFVRGDAEAPHNAIIQRR